MHLSIHKTTVLEGLSTSDKTECVHFKTPYRKEILTIVLEGCISYFILGDASLNTLLNCIGGIIDFCIGGMHLSMQ